MSTIAKHLLSSRKIDDQIRRAKSVQVELRETLEDLEDRRTIEKAKKRNGKKVGTSWNEVVREMGIAEPSRKH